jgi:hypothetical protein
VLDSWSKPTHKGNFAANINAKFKRLRYDLKLWSKSISKLSICIENSNKAILELDNIENVRPLFLQEVNFGKILKKHLARLLEYQNAYWKKRCTIRWMKFGDENTKFFQSIATERHRRNSIASILLTDGSVAEEHIDKEKAIYQAFKERLGTCTSPAMHLDLPALITPTSGLEELSLPFTKKEIDEVIRAMPADKAPGPDGFNGHFLKSCWNIIKEDIYRLCFDFYDGKLDLTSINMGHITLIPKIQFLKEFMIIDQLLH